MPRGVLAGFWCGPIALASYRRSRLGRFIPGGSFTPCELGPTADTPTRRPRSAARLGEAAATHDLVELEAPHDLVPGVLAVVPPGSPADHVARTGQRSPALTARLQWLSGVEAATYQLIVTGDRLRTGSRRSKCFRRRPARRGGICRWCRGAWSRVLSPLLGSPFVFGSLEDETVTGEPRVARLVDDFGLPDPGPVQ